MEVDQRGTDQRGRFHGDPHQTHVPADHHQGHRRQEQQQAAGERGLRRVGEQRTFLEIGVRLQPRFLAQVAYGVE